jgi:hypothetical protein
VTSLTNIADSCIVKQPECAAAINSSGFVPTPVSKREPKEYCVFSKVVLCVINFPLFFNEPFHTAVAFLLITIFDYTQIYLQKAN